jgi:hypothetical protein
LSVHSNMACSAWPKETPFRPMPKGIGTGRGRSASTPDLARPARPSSSIASGATGLRFQPGLCVRPDRGQVPCIRHLARSAWPDGVRGRHGRWISGRASGVVARTHARGAHNDRGQHQIGFGRRSSPAAQEADLGITRAGPVRGTKHPALRCIGGAEAVVVVAVRRPRVRGGVVPIPAAKHAVDGASSIHSPIRRLGRSTRRRRGAATRPSLLGPRARARNAPRPCSAPPRCVRFAAPSAGA